MRATKRTDHEKGTPEQAHARERFWQIFLPLLLICALLIAGFVLLLIYSGELGSSTEGIAATALVAIALPVMLVFLVSLVILVALIVAVSKASAWLPGAGKQAFGVFRSIGAAAEDGSRAVLAPFVGVSQKLAELQGLFSALRSSWKKGIFR